MRKILLLLVVIFASLHPDRVSGKEISVHLTHIPYYSNVNIIILGKSDNIVNNGARFLANSLAQAGQNRLKISVSSREMVSNTEGTNIYICNLDVLNSLNIFANVIQLGSDGILMKSLKNNEVVLSGENSNSTLYAISYFLENIIGFKWWTPNDIFIPQLKELKVDNLDYTYTPPLYFRSHFSNSILDNAKFAALMYENNSLQKNDALWGNNLNVFGWSHTFNTIIPVETYFQNHPEWFSDPLNHDLPCTKLSKRPSAKETQLCLENPELLREFIKNSRNILNKNPKIDIFSISINDNRRYCHCDMCQKQIKIDGSPSGSLIRFVNNVRSSLINAFPKVKFETLAYYSFISPPKVSKPDKDIVVRIAPLDADFGHCLNGKYNEELYGQVRAWGRINFDNHLWLYNTNFNYLMIPHPSLRSIACYLRTGVNYNVKGAFVQDNKYTNGIGYFLDMQTWVLSKLLWQPSHDVDSLINEFMNNYYGAGGQYLLQYFYLVESSFKETNNPLVPYNLNLSYLNRDLFSKSDELFSKAFEAVRGNSQLSERIQREFISLLYAKVVTQADYNFRKSTLNFMSDLNSTDDSIELLFNMLKKFQVTRVDMKLNLNEFEQKLRQNAKAIRTYSSSPSANIDIQESDFTLFKKGVVTKIVVDTAASNGKAVKINGDSQDWAIQAKLTNLGSILSKNNWNVKFRMKIKENRKKLDSPGIIRTGVYDNSFRKQKITINTKIQSLKLGEYFIIEIPNVLLTENDFLWISILDKKSNLEGLYLDKIVLSKSVGK